MAYSCIVNGCETKFRTSVFTRQHRIPRNQTLRLLWMSILKLKEDEIKSHTAVCDLHFKDIYTPCKFTKTKLSVIK